MIKKTVAIIGGGPAGMMAAHTLAPAFNVFLYEKEKTIGRKFLVAGKGGFNLSNSVQGEALHAKYLPEGAVDACLQAFDTQALREWLLALNIPTYTGTSGRVFPEKGIKPVEVLDAIRKRLVEKGVQILTHHTFEGFGSQQELLIRHKDQQQSVQTDFSVFAMGGASWPETGSNGQWTQAFEHIGVPIKPFQSSNCGIQIVWPEAMVIHAGKPLKNIALSVNDIVVRGEASITQYGLEGNAVYPITPAIREMLNATGRAQLHVDLKPDNTLTELEQKVQEKHVKSRDYPQVFNLNPVQLALLKSYTDKNTYTDPQLFVPHLKKLTLPVIALRPVAEAISTVGGIPLEALNPDFSLKKHPNIFIAGEMLDWDAPTGGFLLQGCFATGYYVAKKIKELAKNN